MAMKRSFPFPLFASNYLLISPQPMKYLNCIYRHQHTLSRKYLLLLTLETTTTNELIKNKITITKLNAFDIKLINSDSKGCGLGIPFLISQQESERGSDCVVTSLNHNVCRGGRDEFALKLRRPHSTTTKQQNICSSRSVVPSWSGYLAGYFVAEIARWCNEGIACGFVHCCR